MSCLSQVPFYSTYYEVSHIFPCFFPALDCELMEGCSCVPSSWTNA